MPRSSMSGEWYDMLNQFNGRKMIALAESGTLPNASVMNTYDIAWNYFSLWKDGFLDDFSAQQVQTLLNDNRHHHAQRAADVALEQLGTDRRRLQPRRRRRHRRLRRLAKIAGPNRLGPRRR